MEKTGCRSIWVAMPVEINYNFLFHAWHHHDRGANLAMKSVYWWQCMHGPKPTVISELAVPSGTKRPLYGVIAYMLLKMY